ncbi:MAG: DUF3822 family protein [Bacteroidota bacterium]
MKNVPPLLSLESPKGFFTADASIDTGGAGTCELYIHFTAGAMTLALRERSTKKYLAAECVLALSRTFSSLPDQFRSCIENSLIIKSGHFKNTTICIANNYATLLPSSLYRPGDEQSVLNFAVTRNDLIAGSNKVNGYDIRLVFGIQPELQSLMLQTFPGASITHALIPALEFQSLLGASSKETTVQIIAHPELTTAIVSQGKKLLFANSYQTKDAEESTYYVLNALNELDVDLQLTPCSLNGTFFNCEQLRARLQPYLPDICSLDRIGFASLSRSIEQIPASNLLPVVSLELCA